MVDLTYRSLQSGWAVQQGMVDNVLHAGLGRHMFDVSNLKRDEMCRNASSQLFRACTYA